MARTPSTMLALGTPAPDFALPDTVSGRTVRLADVATSKGLLVMFLCNHCPFVKHVRAGVATIGRDTQALGVGVVAISSNDVDAHPDDAPALMTREAAEAGYTFPYLYDQTQQVAKDYQAACTPDFYLFNGARRLVYRGQMDASRPPSKGYPAVPVTGEDLRAAIAAMLAGKAVNPDQRPSLGCNIKWKPGNAPAYFAN
ncbi:MAG: thioredoxin family protein [bacterium]|jgi:peroxiredoxin|nr:thioredoxin family protein [Phycisphaerales bacterium]MCE2653598.1 thioredoxin family protein [Planctomycetaceae bacterium]